MDSNLIEHNFTYHPPNDTQKVIYEQLRAMYLALANQINDMCPDSREKSLAMTNLEQSNMWANASIAREK